jgi:hypothetical protein
MTDRKYMAFYADTETWATPYNTIYVEVSNEEAQEIFDDEDKVWKHPTELKDGRDMFSLMENGKRMGEL